MPYSVPFWRITNLMHINGTDETAAFGVDVTGAPIQLGLEPTLAFAEDFVNAAQDLLEATKSARADYSRLDGVKVARIGTDGHYTGDAVIAPATDAKAGTFAGMPPQISVVCTLFSGTSLGKGNYGRFYLPYSGYTEVGTPYMSTTLTNLFLSAFQDYIQDIEANVPSGTGVTIMSQAGTGSAKDVSQVRCGRVIDTQRRRRSALDESYVSAAV